MVNRIVMGCCLALILGVAAGMPILLRSVAVGEQPKLYADVVYAYFLLSPSNQSFSESQNGTLASFLFVLNVTNLSTVPAEVTRADAIAAGELEFATKTQNNTGFFNETITNSLPSIMESWNNTTQIRWENQSVGYGYAGVMGERSESFEGSEYLWPENTSKLVALSGMANLPETTLALLRSTKILLFSHVEGEAHGNGVPADGAYVIKGVQLETIGDSEFVFNELLTDNQTLQVLHDGTGVTIVSGT